jgi:hypothetical protein
MRQLHFDFRDVFRAGRYGFSGKKMTVHFLGLLLAYLIYEILVYLSLLISGGNAARAFWNSYALLPAHPWSTHALSSLTVGAMGVGLFICFVIFFLTSTMVSKITIQQLRGDSFFSMRESLEFTKRNWKSVFGTFIGLIVIFILFALAPIFVAVLGKIPVVGRVVVMLASLLTPLAFIIGLLMTYIMVVLSVSLFFAPAVVAAADADAFESIYQQLSLIWNQPWRLAVYEALLFGLKGICVTIWGVFCLLGFSAVVLPTRYLLPIDTRYFMGHANEWLGQIIKKVFARRYLDDFVVFDRIAPAKLPVAEFSGFELFLIKATSVCMTLSLLFLAGLVIAYLFSIASAGNTIIYTVLRRRIDGQNLLEVEEEEGMSPPELPDSENSEEAADSSETQVSPSEEKSRNDATK